MNLQKIKTEALKSNNPEARVIFDYVRSLEDKKLSNEEISLRLTEVSRWAEQFRNSMRKE